MIEEDRLISGMGILVNLLELPTVQSHWEQRKSGFVAEYRDYIDELIENARNQ